MTSSPAINIQYYGNATRLTFGPTALLSSGLMLTGLSNASAHVRIMTMGAAEAYLTPVSMRLPLEYEFAAKAAEWRAETKFLSSPEMIASHPAYQRIIGMGTQVVPLILREMEQEPGLWFEALMALTDTQPVPIEHAGDIDAMTADWLAWGRQNGVLES